MDSIPSPTCFMAASKKEGPSDDGRVVCATGVLGAAFRTRHSHHSGSLAFEHGLPGQPLVLERDPQVGTANVRQREEFLRAWFRVARTAIDGGFHRLPLFVPGVLAAAGADERCLPELLVQLDWVQLGIAALPFVQDR